MRRLKHLLLLLVLEVPIDPLLCFQSASAVVIKKKKGFISSSEPKEQQQKKVMETLFT